MMDDRIQHVSAETTTFLPGHPSHGNAHVKYDPKGLNYFLAALALISSMIGGGIAQLPFSYIKTGFTFGIITNILIIIQTILSCYLYL